MSTAETVHAGVCSQNEEKKSGTRKKHVYRKYNFSKITAVLSLNQREVGRVIPLESHAVQSQPMPY